MPKPKKSYVIRFCLLFCPSSKCIYHLVQKMRISLPLPTFLFWISLTLTQSAAVVREHLSSITSDGSSSSFSWYFCTTIHGSLDLLGSIHLYWPIDTRPFCQIRNNFLINWLSQNTIILTVYYNTNPEIQFSSVHEWEYALFKLEVMKSGHKWNSSIFWQESANVCLHLSLTVVNFTRLQNKNKAVSIVEFRFQIGFQLKKTWRKGKN